MKKDSQNIDELLSLRLYINDNPDKFEPLDKCGIFEFGFRIVTVTNMKNGESWSCVKDFEPYEADFLTCDVETLCQRIDMRIDYLIRGVLVYKE